MGGGTGVASIEDDDRTVLELVRTPGSEKAAELKLDDSVDAFFLRVREGVLNFLLAGEDKTDGE